MFRVFIVVYVYLGVGASITIFVMDFLSGTMFHPMCMGLYKLVDSVVGFSHVWVESNLGTLACSLLFPFAFFAAALVVSFVDFLTPPFFVVLVMTTLGCVLVVLV
jgi:hypothetical protein